MAILPSSRLHLYLLPNKHLINTLMTLVKWPGMCVCVCVCVHCVRACVCVCVCELGYGGADDDKWHDEGDGASGDLN